MQSFLALVTSDLIVLASSLKEIASSLSPSQDAEQQHVRCVVGSGKSTPRVGVEEPILRVAAPVGSRFKRYEDFVVQDLVLRAQLTRYRRERWMTMEGTTIVAALPPGVSGHFGRELRRFVLLQHHQAK